MKPRVKKIVIGYLTGSLAFLLTSSVFATEGEVPRAVSNFDPFDLIGKILLGVGIVGGVLLIYLFIKRGRG